MYDIIIIGGGPAGVSAGIYAASRGKKTLLIEKKNYRQRFHRYSLHGNYAA